MTTLLHIDSSPRMERSSSRRLTAHFVECWRCLNPDGMIISRDLATHALPFITEEWIAAAFADASQHSERQQKAIAVSNELVDELIRADELVIGSPMYNYTVNAALKAWIDQVVRVGRTIAYPSYEGLLRGKRATILATRGESAVLPNGEPSYDAQIPYLRYVLGFLGIVDVRVVQADQLAGDAETRRRSMDGALTKIEKLF